MNKQNKYHHITKEERTEIAFLCKKGYSIGAIAEALSRSKGAISEELNRNEVNGEYDAKKAQHKACLRRKNSKYEGMKVVSDANLRQYIEKRIGEDDWSPEQVAGRLKNVDTGIKYASKEAIYKYVFSIYGRNLENNLRYKGKKKSRKRTKVGQLKNRTFIEERPAIIEQRGRFGDWEGDFIVSGKNGSGALLVLHERKARFTVIDKLDSRSPSLVNQRLGEITGGFAFFNSLTLDNDISFKLHEEMSKIMGCPVYFCHPYHSWEKGGVENTNKLIRQYIPKSSDISKFSIEYIKGVENKLNNRPRKCLGFKTPSEVMEENNQFKAPFFLEENQLKFKINKNTQVVRLGG